MAERSGSKRTLACILVGLGALLLVAAILIPTYTVSRLAKTPLDLEVTTVAPSPKSEVLDSRSLTAPTGAAVVDKDVPIVSQRFLTVEDPSDSKKMTIQMGQTLRRTDKQGDTGLLTAIVDRVTIDRKTGEPTDDPIGSIQLQSDKPGQEVSHTGLQYRFPFDTEKKTYPFFDVNARQSFPMDFVDEQEINGQKVYHFHQKTPIVDLSKVVNLPTNKLSLPADKWGVPGGAEPVTMTRWYQNERDYYIEPKTGVVIRGREQVHQFYARSADKPEVTVLKADFDTDQNTINFQLKEAKDGIDKLSLYGRIIPIILGILGALSLLAGLALGFLGGRRKTASASGYGSLPPEPTTGTARVSDTPGNRDWTTDKTEVIDTNKSSGRDWTTDKTEEFPRVRPEDEK
ncbi:DUF3068 domain-containing protein [Antrihabitans cavernicola]|uniref:DUF3068 domain-containing protein n=1 Tax=Antrihabitans cavernicola TaxID=2495913 RepID=A0A5A7S4K7_9NOCA|nr:DUF3068 domain-containing protein [Spelaeibacter cavernicola]KAA0017390.1 DUF3068 domain-containing protein [Spelaeibacter cavernicola]